MKITYRLLTGARSTAYLDECTCGVNCNDACDTWKRSGRDNRTGAPVKVRWNGTEWVQL